jgi:hypothetical protein
MKDTLECSVCHDENAFYNGVNYECPNCDSAWDDDEILYNGLDVGNVGNQKFKQLSKLDKPFFTLKHGEIYECTVAFESHKGFMEEQLKIVPLAFKDNKNLFFILLYHGEIPVNFSETIKDLVKMDFITLWNDGLDNYFEVSEVPMNIVVSSTEENTLIDHKGDTFSNFKEID